MTRFTNVYGTIRVIHWKDTESSPLVEAVRSFGFEVEYTPSSNGAEVARELRVRLPDAIVIDLSRLPGHGREMGVWLRNRKATRNIPLIYVEGDPEKVERVKAVIPDAVYTRTSELGPVLRKACKGKVANPAVPPSAMERFKTKTAAQKLGIVAGSTAAVIDPPRDYATVLGEMPEGAELLEDLLEDPAAIQPVTLWFIRDSDAMLAGLRRMRAIAAKTKLWILWPKAQTNRFREGSIRALGIAHGLVDYKICSVNEQWSGILFARKREKDDRSA
jgi:CheY-like chemotaxis protein